MLLRKRRRLIFWNFFLAGKAWKSLKAMDRNL
jgi:hypothetical protein